MFIEESAGERMLSYADITNRYADYETQKRYYWDGLSVALGQLVKDLTASLSLPSETWEDASHEIHRYVEIGAYKSGKFTSMPLHQLEGNGDLTLPFAIKLSLEQSPNTYPKQGYVVSGKISQRDGKFFVELTDTNSPSYLVTSVRDGAFNDVAEGIKQVVVSSLDPRVFGQP